MTIADEMDLALDKVQVTLADARPELIWNQLTGGSNSMHSIYTPVRVAAAIARGQLLQAAAAKLGDLPAMLGVSDGVITAPDGRSMTFGSLASKAAVSESKPAAAKLKRQSQLTLVGTPQRRIDALTGRKQFAMDLAVPRRAADDAVPPADDQRHRAVRAQSRDGQGDARDHRRRAHPPHELRRRRRRRACGRA